MCAIHTPSDDPFESHHELFGQRRGATRVVPKRGQWQVRNRKPTERWEGPRSKGRLLVEQRGSSNEDQGNEQHQCRAVQVSSGHR
jgi:hypothetical protein